MNRKPRVLDPCASPVPRAGRRSCGGITLIETTVMLSVLFILAGALTPVVSDSLGTAREVRARQDVEEIANGLVHMLRDVGTLTPFRQTSASTLALDLQLVDTSAGSRPFVAVLASEGDLPGLPEDDEDDTGYADADAATSPLRAFPGRLAPRVARAASRPWVDLPAESIDEHLRESLSYGAFSARWNGPYLSEVIGDDPWGHRYLVNTAFSRLGGAYTADPDCCAVFVVSAGPDGVIDTPFRQPMSNAAVRGDDIAIRIQ